jgi:hypothetical protein
MKPRALTDADDQGRPTMRSTNPQVTVRCIHWANEITIHPGRSDDHEPARQRAPGREQAKLQVRRVSDPEHSESGANA